MEDEMFKNLIESSSHRSEFRRRGSFFLFTTASYALLFVIAGVVSIYAYDARMEDQNLELATIMPLVDLPAPVTPPETTPTEPRPASGHQQNEYIRTNPTATVDVPQLAPHDISSSPNPNPPIPPGTKWKVGPENVDPVQPDDSTSRTGGRGNTGNPGPSVAISEPPPVPAPAPKPAPKVIRKQILNGEALELPKPQYPPIAKTMGVRGTVNVQVLIDEKGKVVSATTVSGHPLLAPAAKAAAWQARFSPTMLGDQPVKVSGVITYNFILQ
jgi:periplasmic protein TonB